MTDTLAIVSRVAVDVGSGFTKIITDDQHLAFPSVVALFPEYDFFKSEEAERITLDGRDWIVGDSAINVTTEHDRQDTLLDAWAGSPGWMALLFAAFIKANVSNKVELVTGIPQAQYRDRERLQALRSQLKGNHTIGWMGQTYQFSISKVRIIPQATGAVLCKAAQDETVLDDTVGIIDIGTYTTGLSVLRRSEFMENRAGGVAVGISDLISALVAHFEREYRIAPDKAQVPDILMNKKVRSRGEIIDVSRDIDLVSRRVARPMQDAVISTWRGGNDLTIFIAGGGAPYFVDALQEVVPHARLMEDNFYAVARGMLYFLEHNG